MLKDRLQNKRLAVSQMAFWTRKVSELSKNGSLVMTIGLGPAKLKESLMMTLINDHNCNRYFWASYAESTFVIMFNHFFHVQLE